VTFEQKLAEQRPYIERLIHELARRHYLASADVEEFRGAVDRAFERNDYELLRAFDGRATWERYLSIVVTQQFFQFRRAMWGQWRPSSAAYRLGPAAILLEELVRRDRFTLNDAIDWMRTTHHVDEPRHRLQQLAEQLGISPGANPRTATPATAPPEVREALRTALGALAADDRLILELRFRDRQPLTRIAILLNTEARPLQRRIDGLIEQVRAALLEQGLSPSNVDALLTSVDAGLPEGRQAWWQFALARPSKDSTG
jgi:hypothetical protein